MSRPLQPPMRKQAKPSSHGAIQSFLFRKTSSGYLEKSLMRS